MSDIMERLRDASGLCLDGGYLCRQAADLIDAERALADDLAAVLAEFADDWLTEGCEGPVSAVLARYREARR